VWLGKKKNASLMVGGVVFLMVMYITLSSHSAGKIGRSAGRITGSTPIIIANVKTAESLKNRVPNKTIMGCRMI